MSRTTAPANAAGLPADPVLAAVQSYRAECERIDALPADSLERAEHPVWNALENGDPLPGATTREGATAALRTALEYHLHTDSRFFVANLLYAALAFFEADAAGDPAIEAIAEWRVVSDRYWSHAGSPDEVMNAAEVVDAAATIRAMNTVPTSLPGLRAFCEMACTMSGRETAGGGGLSDWRPFKGESVEAMFMRTLAAAVRNLLPEGRDP